MSHESWEIFEFGPFKLDLTDHQLTHDEKPVRLTPKAFSVLAHLVRNRGHLVRKEDLLREVWADSFVEEANIARTIWMLRNALNELNGAQQYIQTISKYGYRFLVDVREKVVDKRPRSDGRSAIVNSPSSREPKPDGNGEHALSGALNSNKKTYDRFLHGKYNLRQETKTGIEQAIVHLEEAVRLDPNFALAHAELARAYHLNAYYFMPEEKEWVEKAWVACEWALTLDPFLGDAHFVRGLLLWKRSNGFPHEQVIDEYKRAIKFNPNLDEAHHQLGLVLHHIGLFDRALEHYKLSLAINPSNNIVRVRFAVVENFRHRYEEALRIIDALPPEITPGLYMAKAVALCHLGRLDEANHFSEKVLINNPKDEGGMMASVQALIAALQDDRAQATKMIDHSIKTGQSYGHFHHSTYNIAAALAIMGQAGEAIKWLTFTANDGFPCYPMFQRDPFLTNVAKDKRFIQFMSKQKDAWNVRMKTL